MSWEPEWAAYESDVEVRRIAGREARGILVPWRLLEDDEEWLVCILMCKFFVNCFQLDTAGWEFASDAESSSLIISTRPWVLSEGCQPKCSGSLVDGPYTSICVDHGVSAAAVEYSL